MVAWRPDVVVSRAVSATLYGHAIARLAGAAHVNNEHRQFGKRMVGRRETLLRAVAPRVDRVIAISADQHPDLRRRGFRSDRITVIPNAVDETSFVPVRTREDIRREFRLAEDAFAVVVVAALRPEKRVERFVEAVAEARRTAPRLEGFVVGDGPERAGLEAAAARSGGVRFLGARTDVADVLHGMDAFCLSSEAEGVPMAILEAMSLGRPVVATDVGGVREAVVHGESGLLVPAGAPEELAAALATLATDPERARRMGQAGIRRQRDRFSAGAMIAAYEAVLADAARARARARGQP